MGLSCRHDVMELLEKRVRSRFSHRKQLIPEMDEGTDQAGNSPQDVLAAMLSVPEPSCSAEHQAGAVQQWNAGIAQCLKSDQVNEQLKLMLNQGQSQAWQACSAEASAHAEHPAPGTCAR